MKSRVFLSSFLIIIALILTFLTAKAILRPAKFSEVYTMRRTINENRLTAIAELQKLYKKEHNEYANSIDNLVNFYENGFFTVTSVQRVADSIPENMTMEEAEKQGFYKRIETKIPIKDKMEEILAEINKQKAEPVVMENFQYIPFAANEEKYKIETGHSDSTIQKFAVYVPTDVLLNDFEASTLSADANFIKKGIHNLFYKNLENESRERRKCVGLQLGDTVKPSIEIVDFGKKDE